MVGHGGHEDLHVGPLGLYPALHPAQHARCATGGGGHQEVVLAQARGDTVVKHHAVFVEHEAVAALARFQLEEGVGVHPVEQLGRVWALNVDLAQGGGVHDAYAMAHGQHLALDRLVHVFLALREIPGPLPLAHVFKQATGGHMVFMRAGLAGGVKQITALEPGKQAKADGQVVGAEGGGAHLVDGFFQGPGGQRHAVDVAQLALVGAKAQRGVALDVLDGFKPFANGQLDVTGRHIVLVVHKGLGPA